MQLYLRKIPKSLDCVQFGMFSSQTSINIKIRSMEKDFSQSSGGLNLTQVHKTALQGNFHRNLFSSGLFLFITLFNPSIMTEITVRSVSTGAAAMLLAQTSLQAC